MLILAVYYRPPDGSPEIMTESMLTTAYELALWKAIVGDLTLNPNVKNMYLSTKIPTKKPSE